MQVANANFWGDEKIDANMVRLLLEQQRYNSPEAQRARALEDKYVQERMKLAEAPPAAAPYHSIVGANTAMEGQAAPANVGIAGVTSPLPPAAPANTGGLVGPSTYQPSSLIQGIADSAKGHLTALRESAKPTGFGPMGAGQQGLTPAAPAAPAAPGVALPGGGTTQGVNGLLTASPGISAVRELQGIDRQRKMIHDQIEQARINGYRTGKWDEMNATINHLSATGRELDQKLLAGNKEFAKHIMKTWAANPSTDNPELLEIAKAYYGKDFTGFRSTADGKLFGVAKEVGADGSPVTQLYAMPDSLNTKVLTAAVAQATKRTEKITSNGVEVSYVDPNENTTLDKGKATTDAIEMNRRKNEAGIDKDRAAASRDRSSAEYYGKLSDATGLDIDRRRQIEGVNRYANDLAGAINHLKATNASPEIIKQYEAEQQRVFQQRELLDSNYSPARGAQPKEALSDMDWLTKNRENPVVDRAITQLMGQKGWEKMSEKAKAEETTKLVRTLRNSLEPTGDPSHAYGRANQPTSDAPPPMKVPRTAAEARAELEKQNRLVPGQWRPNLGGTPSAAGR